MPGALLVADQDVADLLRVQQRVVRRAKSHRRDAEDHTSTPSSSSERTTDWASTDPLGATVEVGRCKVPPAGDLVRSVSNVCAEVKKPMASAVGALTRMLFLLGYYWVCGAKNPRQPWLSEGRVDRDGVY